MRDLERIRVLLRPIMRRVLLLAARGVLRVSDDGPKLQTLQSDFLKNEPRGPLERFGQFGLSSRPPDGAEVVALFFGGTRDHGVVVAVEDRRARPRDLEKGESILYATNGLAPELVASVRLRQDGTIEVTSNGPVKVTAPRLELVGDLTVSGSIDVQGSLTAAGDVSDSAGSLATLRQGYDVHTHPGVQTGSGSTGPPVPQV